MFELRDLQFLAALARQRHFARAAEECGVSQPAFSMRIRKLEDRLGAQIVKRGNRFEGFTTEGELIVGHAQKILDDVRVLQQEVLASGGTVTGPVSLGVIPTVVAYAAQLALTLNENYPGITLRILTATSLAVQQGVEDGRFDAGLTYSDGASEDMLQIEPIYDETYVLLAPQQIAPRVSGAATWEEAAQLPLCLLEPGMQNRRILDRQFGDLGLEPQIVCEANGLHAGIVMALQAPVACILPRVLADSFTLPDQIAILRLAEPVLAKEISLVTSARAPDSPALVALRQAAEETRHKQ
ncbi:MAG: LysR family transcriptional regulator [Pseudomonadota bacterium]